MTTLSVAMIVKDEESMLPGCLESIQGLADELVVIDTGGSNAAPGSSDATRRLVIEFSDHAPVTYKERPWRGDFSLHRNQSLDLASGDWVLVLDADERVALAPGLTPEGFKALLADAPEGLYALAVQLEDIQAGRMVMTCNQARLFRPGVVRYQGRVHNQPVYQPPLGVLPHQMHILHLGYDAGRRDQEAKFQRQRGLLEKRLAEAPDDPETAFYLCQLYGNADQAEESIRWGERYLARREALGQAFNHTILFTLAAAYAGQGQADRALELIRTGLEDQPHNPDLACALTDFAEKAGDDEAVQDGCRRYLAGYQAWLRDPASLGPLFYFSLQPQVRERLALRLALATLGRAAEHLHSEALELAPNLAALGLALPEARPRLAAVGGEA